MNWPFVSRVAFDNEREARRVQMIELREAQAECVGMVKAVSLWERTSDAYKDAWADEKRRADTLAERYHALATLLAAQKPLTVSTVASEWNGVAYIPEPDTPPAVVLAAMKRISPTPDKTYEANWRYWEAHKEQAEAHPEAFAEEIIAGVGP